VRLEYWIKNYVVVVFVVFVIVVVVVFVNVVVVFLVHAKVVSGWVSGVVGGHELLGQFEPRVLIKLNRAIVGEFVEAHCRLVFGDVPELLKGDELITVNLTITVLVGVGEGGLEESLEVLWNGTGGSDLGRDANSPVAEFAAVDLAIVVNISVVHQELEGFLLVLLRLLVESITLSDAGSLGELLQDSLIVLEVDDTVAVDVISVVEKEFEFGLKEITHLGCLKCC